MKKIHLIIIFIVILLFSNCKEHHKTPNVIFIYADDLGKGMISAYGQQHFRTPNIDSLIHGGLAFSNAYGCMLSAPARASMLTGYHDCRKDKWKISSGGQLINSEIDTTMIYEREYAIDKQDIILKEGDDYLPEIFKKAGYITAQIGKLEWGFTATRTQMQQHGWDYYYGYLDHVRCHGFYPPFLFNDGAIEFIEGNTLTNCGKSLEPETEAAFEERWNRTGKTTYSQDLFLEKILSFIRENKKRPFFLYHPTQLPHGPVSIPEINPELVDNNNLTSVEKEYASMVKMLDNHIGIIWNELKTLGIEENTMIIFASDNGHEIYYSQQKRCEKPYRNMLSGDLFDDYTNKYYSNLSGDRFNGNCGMAGLKRSNLEGGVRIPLIFYQKGRWEGGKKCNQLVSMYDFLPTMAEMLKIELPIKKDGISFYKYLTHCELQQEERYVVYSSFLGPAIVTNDGWKLRYYHPKRIFELYHITTDWKETNNVIEENPIVVEKLKTLLLNACNGNIENGIYRN